MFLLKKYELWCIIYLSTPNNKQLEIPEPSWLNKYVLVYPKVLANTSLSMAKLWDANLSIKENVY